MRISDWSSDVCSSDLTLAFTEPNGKWDASGLEATASKDGDAYKISGTKMFVLDGAQANLLIVAPKTDAGVSLFAVHTARSKHRTAPCRDRVFPYVYITVVAVHLQQTNYRHHAHSPSLT